jgi:hypothetical protein
MFNKDILVGHPPAIGPDTYLNGARNGWPHAHSVEDAYECPPYTWTPDDYVKTNARTEGKEYSQALAEADAISAKQAEQAFLKSILKEVAVPLPVTGLEPRDDIEYIAEFTTTGGAVLRKRTISYKTIANFDTYADAETAAEALNNHEGY